MPEPCTSLFDRMGGRPALVDLLRHFYADVRQHEEIGPIFAAHVSDWPAHLEKIADFWSGVTGGPAIYKGPMPFKHVHLHLEERHFQAWLGLWHRHCRMRLPEPEALDMIRAAEGIGQNLRLIIAMHSARQKPSKVAGSDRDAVGVKSRRRLTILRLTAESGSSDYRKMKKEMK